MKRFISYGSIGQLRNVIDDLDFISKHRPIVTALGTEKVHGTNAAVCFNDVSGMWVQSRKNIITSNSDNAGCAKFAEDTAENWVSIIKELSAIYDIDLNESTVVIYFEWAGGSIQKNSALKTLDKRAMLFPHFKVVDIDGEPNEFGFEKCEWYENKIDCPEANIFSLSKSQTWDLLLDFNNPATITNDLNMIINSIETNSPLGNSFGIDGNIAEGIVVTFMYEGKLFRFKVKGERHTTSTVRELTPEEVESEQVKVDFVNLACTASRLEQAWQTVFGIDNENEKPDMRHIGSFIKAVNADIIKEESDILEDMDLTIKDVSRMISRQSGKWFKDQLNSF